MKRSAIIIRKSKDQKRYIAIDAQTYNVIIGFLKKDKRHQNKFIDIANVILHGLRNPQLYDKEEIDKKSKGVRAMKFFKGQENARIYCKEVTQTDRTFVVIASELIEQKKSQKITNKIKNIIHRVANYEYDEIIDPEKH